LVRCRRRVQARRRYPEKQATGGVARSVRRQAMPARQGLRALMRADMRCESGACHAWRMSVAC